MGWDEMGWDGMCDNHGTRQTRQHAKTAAAVVLAFSLYFTKARCKPSSSVNLPPPQLAASPLDQLDTSPPPLAHENGNKINQVKRSMKAVRVVVGERQRAKRAVIRERQLAAKREKREAAAAAAEEAEEEESEAALENGSQVTSTL